MSIGGVLSNMTNLLLPSKFSASGNNPNVLSNFRFIQINTIYSQCFVHVQPDLNLLEMSNRACLIECEEKINGFIRELKIVDEFYLQLHTHHQIRAIESVPAQNRILHIGAREKLIKPPDGLYTQGENSDVVNYFFLMNDLTQLFSTDGYEKYKTLISEVATTASHSVYRMVSMLENIGKDYVKIFKNSRLSFRLVVTDMTWSVIESVIEILNNNEGVENYAERVFKLANLESDPNESDLSWLCACPKILYFKLAKSVAQFKENIKTYSFVCLKKLASCTDLNSFDHILKKTLIFFLSKRQTNQWIEACNFFEIFSGLINADGYKLFNCGNLKYIGYSQLIFDEIENTKTREMKRRLRNDSSFARHFKQLINSIRFEKEEPDMDENVFYCPKIADILLNEFIPYAFIWAGFVHRDLPQKNDDDNIKKDLPQEANIIEILSNSPIDTFVRTRLRVDENIIPVFPDEYIKKTYKYALELSLGIVK